MHKYHPSKIGLLAYLILLGACHQHGPNSSQPINGSMDEAEEKHELPINVVIKKETKKKPIMNDQSQPIPDAAVVPGAPVIPGLPPLPPLAPVLPPPLVDDEGSDDEEECETPYCGNGIKQDDEQCDDGNDINNDSCDNYCRIPTCGNGIIEGDEECDQPTNVNCVDCKLPTCGNNHIDAGETCDPPNNSNCNYTCKLSVCGNGIVELGEQCDDGNANENDGCNNSCQISLVPGNTVIKTKRSEIRR